MTKITKGTLVPLSLVGSCIASVVGGVFWLTTMHAQGNATAQGLSALGRHQDEFEKSLADSIHQIQRDQYEVRKDVSELRGEVRALLRETRKRF